MQSEINRLNDQSVQCDNNLKLLAEGTLSLSEKDKQYQMKMDLMKKDLQNFAQAVEARMDSRFGAIDNNMQMNKTATESQVDIALKKYGEHIALMEKKIVNSTDDKVAENRHAMEIQIAKNIDVIKNDYEALMNKVGGQF